MNKQLEEIILSLNQEELKETKKLIEKQLAEKTKKEKVIYTHNCYNASNNHFRKYKHWCKLIEDIDSSKTNGFAFIGEFLFTDKENLVDKNSYVVEVCANDLSLYKIIGDNEKELILEGKSSKYVSFIKGCVKAINE